MRKLRAALLAATIAGAAIAITALSMGSAVAAPSAPTATTGSPSNVAESSATVSATVNPHGTDTHYHFEYGTTTAYGTNTASANAGAGSTDVGVSANLTGLAAGTTYHYRVVASSSAGNATGADQTFTTTTSQAVILGREGFVSPGRIVGVELGCFHGTTTCAGQLTMTHNGTVIAQRNYSIPADSGGFQNMKLSSSGMSLLGSNRVFHLLPVTVTATASNGQKLSFVIHLARWVWH